MNTRLTLCSAMTLALSTSLALAGNNDTFTYQGILQQGGSVVNGSPNITMRLFDVPVGGAELDSELFIAQPVVDGLLAIDLPFEAIHFDGGDRYLQIEVNGIPLSPRQPVLPTPYAMHAQSAATVDLVPDGALPPVYAAPVDFSNATNTYAGDGSGLTNLNPASLSGPLLPAQLPSGGAWGLSSSLSIDADTLFVDATSDWVGIGTNSPQTALHIFNTNPRLTLHDSNDTGADQEGFVSFKDSSDVETAWLGFVGDPNFYVRNNIGDIFLDPASSVAIGTTTPDAALHVYAGGPYIAATYSRSIRVGGVGLHGECTVSAQGTGVKGTGSTFDFYANGAGTDYGSSSSRRWKRNIEAINDPLQKLSQLRGVYYDWIEERGGHHDVGMIAEEVGAVLPEIVQYETNGIDAIGMDYSKMTPLLVEAVNALRAEKDSAIASLRAENEALQVRLDALESLVTRLASAAEERTQ